MENRRDLNFFLSIDEKLRQKPTALNTSFFFFLRRGNTDVIRDQFVRTVQYLCIHTIPNSTVQPFTFAICIFAVCIKNHRSSITESSSGTNPINDGNFHFQKNSRGCRSALR